jgi:hypothetical protein
MNLLRSMKGFIAGVCSHLLDVDANDIELVLNTVDSVNVINTFLSRPDTMALYVETARDSSSHGK